MHALERDETCAEADLPDMRDMVIASTIDDATKAASEERGKAKRTTKRLTIPEQDKLRERIARLESRLRYTGVAMVAVALIGLVVGKALGVWL